MVGGAAYHPYEYFWIFLWLISLSSQTSEFPSWGTSRALLPCHKLARFSVTCHNSSVFLILWSQGGIIGDSCLPLFLVRRQTELTAVLIHKGKCAQLFMEWWRGAEMTGTIQAPL